MAIIIKTPEEIEGMRKACRLASEVLDFIEPFVVPGAKTIDLDNRMNDFMIEHGAKSACLGYAPKGFTPYPGSTCISVNHVVCHGIPSEKALKKGDIVNIDVTVILDGFYGDTSRMFMVGNKVSVSAKHLVEATYASPAKRLRTPRGFQSSTNTAVTASVVISMKIRLSATTTRKTTA